MRARTHTHSHTHTHAHTRTHTHLQNLVLFALVLPAAVTWHTGRSGGGARAEPWSMLDTLATLAFLFFLAGQ